jgi:hypothetical protein
MKKKIKICLIYKEIQIEADAKSYMRKGFLIYEEMRKYLVTYEEAFVIHDFATTPFWIFLYMRKISFSFLSVRKKPIMQNIPGQKELNK